MEIIIVIVLLVIAFLAIRAARKKKTPTQSTSVPARKPIVESPSERPSDPTL